MLVNALAAGDALPSEFQIWHAGINPTANGYDVNFTEAAAKSVMADYQKHGVDLMIDLEHLSLDQDSRAYDPSARGWCVLEIRRDANGGPELWAANVRWTPDGEKRLSNREARYPSPAFLLNDKNEPISVLNIALVAMPGTDGILPLVASRVEPRRKKMIKLSKLGAVLAALKTLSVEEVKTLAEEGGDLQEVAGTNIADLAAFLGVDVDPGQDPAGFVAALKAKLNEVVSKLDGATAPAAGPTDEPSAEMAAASRLLTLTKTKTLSDALDTVQTLREESARNTETLARIERENQAIKLSKQRALTIRLVKCGAELPATAWTDEKATTPAAHILAMSLEDIEKRCLAFEARGPVGPSVSLIPRLDDNGLSPRELKMLSEIRDPKEREIRTSQYIERKSARKAG